jgi:hypothetical protein
VYRVAVYRSFYGADFIRQSLESIDPYVDCIFVCLAHKPFGKIESCSYAGYMIRVPNAIDNIRDIVNNCQSKKIVVIDYYNSNPHNLWTDLVNNVLIPNHSLSADTLLLVEPDHVWHPNQLSAALEEFESGSLPCASSKQIELWHNIGYRIPERPERIGTVFWKLSKVGKLPETRPSGVGAGFYFLKSHVHNLGFCLSKEVMFWKHVLALNFSKIIGDTQPREDWYESTWLNWHPVNNNKDLDVSAGYEHTIPYAISYNSNELPPTIKALYNVA